MSTLEERFGCHRPKVLELRAEGMSYRKIGLKLGIGGTTAWRLESDDHEARYQAATLASREKAVAA